MPEEGLKRNPSDKKAVFLSDGAKSVQKRAEETLRPVLKETVRILSSYRI